MSEPEVASYSEKQLHFFFPDNLGWEELDRQDVQLPMGMQLVDLVIERECDTLMIEIKDPSDTRAKDKDRNKYLKRLKDNSVITTELTPKARDSYTWLHLMERDEKPIKYIVLLGLDAFEPQEQKAVLGNFKDRLLANLRKENEAPWKRKYVQDCVVLTVDMWNKVFSDWPLKRISTIS